MSACPGEEKECAMVKCKYCGMPMEEDDLFCTRCGKAAEKTASSDHPEEEKTVSGRKPSPKGWLEGIWDMKDRKRTMALAAAAALFLMLLLMARAFSGGADNQHESDPAAVRESRGQDLPDQGGGETDAGGQELPGGDTRTQADPEGRQAKITASEPKEQEAEKTEAGQEQKGEQQEEAAKEDKEDKEEAGEKKKQDAQAMGKDSSLDGAPDGSYILPGSDSRYYSREELQGLDDSTIQMAINELYARHGRRFATESIRQYFESQPWYKAKLDPSAIDGNEDLYFNEYEKANYQLLTQVRDGRAVPAQSQDTGR